jgi:hypothetical protein
MLLFGFGLFAAFLLTTAEAALGHAVFRMAGLLAFLIFLPN